MLVNICFKQTAIGRIGIAEENGSITNLYFETDTLPQNACLSETEVITEAFRQLDAYLSGELQTLTVPLAPQGTDFMRTVWAALCRVPYGKTACYKEIAIAAGSPKAARAVGLANNRNPIPLFIPCHRVIGSDGKLTGYRGGLAIKKLLLDIEKAHGTV